MMDAQLRDIHERGEPIAALWASEETIYGRFGYGLASWCGRDRRSRASGARSRSRSSGAAACASSTPEEARELFPPVWEALMRQRPGRVPRGRRRGGSCAAAHARTRRRRIRGASSCSSSTASRAGVRDLPRSIPTFEDGRRRTRALEVLGGDRRRRRRRPRRSGASCSTSTGTATLEACAAAARPSALPAARESAAAAYRMGDGLWVRLVDVGAALSGRAYAATARSSSTCATRCARGTRAAGSSRAEPRRARTTRPTSRSTSTRSASAYLGAIVVRAAAATRGGSRSSPTERSQRADALFGWRPLPWCPEIF